MKRRIVILGLSLFILQSCTSNTFVVKPNVVDARTQLLFYNSGLLSDAPFTPCLSELILFEDTNPLTVAWLIRSEGSCIPTETVELGRTPSGFREITRFSRLPAGTSVHVSARAGDGRWGGSDPWQLR